MARLRLAFLFVAALTSIGHGGEVNAAIAANFTTVAEQIAKNFEAQTGDKVRLSFGATGGLYAQISQGAPFEIFLAADDERPQKAIEEGLAVEDSAFTYAIGKLVLYSADPEVEVSEQALRSGSFDKLAIADPTMAPYGAAAMETIEALGLRETLQSRLVIGGSISQTLQFVETGNAELGFLALSQVIGKDSGSYWLVPDQFYQPIRQDGVLLKAGAGNPVAEAFYEYLRSDAATKVIEAAGYELARPSRQVRD